MRAAVAIAAAAALGSAQEVPGVREALQERLPDALARTLDLEDPLADDWSSERGNALVGATHGAIARWVAGGDDAPLATLLDLDVRLRIDGSWPDLAREARADGWRAVEPDARERRASGRADVAAALRATFPGGRAESLELKTYQVETPEPGVLLETARLHAAGPLGALGWELTGVWHARWRESAEGLALEALEVDRLQLVCGPRERLVDRTGGTFGATAAFRDELARGLSHWRERLDTRLGQPLLGHPAGVALGDVDGDELEDVFLAQPGGLPNRLFLRRPDGSLADVSARAGVDLLDFSRSALLLDLDRDGDRDLAVVVRSELLLLANRRVEDGALAFERRARFPLPNATMLAAADVEGDGDLDLYACAYFVPYDEEAFPMPYQDARNGARNALLRNEGGWRFTDATDELGLDENNDRFSFAASWEDYDDDGDPDLYVANDFGRNNLYRNDGGRFSDVAAAAGVEDLAAGMGVAWGDADGDGDLDLHVSNMYSSAGKRVTFERRFHADAEPGLRADLRRHALGNTLFANRGDGTFEDVSEHAGVSMGRWAWGSVFLDLDNDARLDLFVPNGFLTEELPQDL